MWATDARFLNDREELLHVDQIAAELIEAGPPKQRVADIGQSSSGSTRASSLCCMLHMSVRPADGSESLVAFALCI